MVVLKSNSEIEKMRRAGQITAGALKAAEEAIHVGMTTEQSLPFSATEDFPLRRVFP